ncbi:MAG TPA: hypothetical protein VMY42_17135 [Thermoguttaceae bacterium]|nr:hypothetical protein [Thermoguttaceae bacterium]
MVDMRMQEELLTQVGQLPSGLQRRVLDFAVALVQSVPKGTPSQDLLRFAGVLKPEDARAMIEAIEQGCEQVDSDGW